MATQTLPAPSVPLQFPRTNPAVETIHQTELQLLLSLRAQLARVQSQVDVAEESLKMRLQSGAIVEPGDHVADLKEHSRRSVPWKEVAIRLANRLKLDGELYAARVLAATRPSKSYSLEVQ